MIHGSPATAGAGIGWQRLSGRRGGAGTGPDRPWPFHLCRALVHRRQRHRPGRADRERGGRSGGGRAFLRVRGGPAPGRAVSGSGVRPGAAGSGGGPGRPLDAEIAEATLASRTTPTAPRHAPRRPPGRGPTFPDELDEDLAEHLVTLPNGRYGWRVCIPAMMSYWSELARDIALPHRGTRTTLVRAAFQDPPYVTEALIDGLSGQLGRISRWSTSRVSTWWAGETGRDRGRHPGVTRLDHRRTGGKVRAWWRRSRPDVWPPTVTSPVRRAFQPANRRVIMRTDSADLRHRVIRASGRPRGAPGVRPTGTAAGRGCAGIRWPGAARLGAARLRLTRTISPRPRRGARRHHRPIRRPSAPAQRCATVGNASGVERGCRACTPRRNINARNNICCHSGRMSHRSIRPSSASPQDSASTTAHPRPTAPAASTG